MNNKLTFVRGNQKNFIRLSLEEEVLYTYEFQMFAHNEIKSFLPFQKRSENGEMYLYYDISGTQSLDIWGQTQKLKRDFLILFVKEILKLCKNIKEYMLSLGAVVLDVKYMMYKADTQEIRFVYLFEEGKQVTESLNDLLEYCVEHLDYSDRQLSDCVFRLYENLQEQGDNFALELELSKFLAMLEEEQKKIAESKEKEVIVNSIEPIEVIAPEETSKRREDVFVSADKRGKRGVLLLLCADVIGIFVWNPLTILKLCFFLSFGVCLLVLYIYINRKEKYEREKTREQEEMQHRTYINEYENIVSQCEEEEGTQFIAIEYMDEMLYNLQGISPQYIHITEKCQLIGKDKEKVQVCISEEGISRVHASVVKKGDECILEDLCSTNGTWANGKNIGTRTPYVLKEGDRIRFATVEYIFR